MHCNGPIVRPQTDAYSIFLEVTVGCTHSHCKFCNFYQGYPFQVASFEQIEGDLQEAAAYAPHAKHVWASGGNPFALGVEHLAKVAGLIRKYLPEARISTYARVNDFEKKSVEDIVVGIESADDDVLSYVKKGYTAADILTQLGKVEEAGAPYRVIYLGGLAGAGRCEESARRTLAALNRLHPYMMIPTAVAVLPGTELYTDLQQGIFQEPTERERLREFRVLLSGLENELTVFAETSANMVGFTARFPREKAQILRRLDDVIAGFTEEDEKRLHAIRAGMTYV